MSESTHEVATVAGDAAAAAVEEHSRREQIEADAQEAATSAMVAGAVAESASATAQDAAEQAEMATGAAAAAGEMAANAQSKDSEHDSRLASHDEILKSLAEGQERLVQLLTAKPEKSEPEKVTVDGSDPGNDSDKRGGKDSGGSGRRAASRTRKPGADDSGNAGNGNTEGEEKPKRRSGFRRGRR